MINENRWPDTIKLGSPAADSYVRAYKYHDLLNFRQRQISRMDEPTQREHRQRAMRAAYIRNHPQTTNGGRI